MPKEIEHRFLVQPERLPDTLPPGARLIHGYLSTGPVVRIRIKKYNGKGMRWIEEAFLTIKGPGKRVREEFEYPIPLHHARQMLKICGDKTLVKTRYKFGQWEVDQYHGRHKGLWLAELELPSECSPLPKIMPEWVGREVTEDPRFTNANLVTLKGSFGAFLKPLLGKSIVKPGKSS